MAKPKPDQAAPFFDALGERLNDEPVIFRGYTDSEFMLALLLAGGTCFPVGVVGGFLAGKVSMGVGAAFMVAIGLVVLGASAYQNWKRGRPVHWLQQRALRRLAELGLARPRTLLHRGVMAQGRDDITRRLKAKKGKAGRTP